MVGSKQLDARITTQMLVLLILYLWSSSADHQKRLLLTVCKFVSVEGFEAVPLFDDRHQPTGGRYQIRDVTLMLPQPLRLRNKAQKLNVTNLVVVYCLRIIRVVQSVVRMVTNFYTQLKREIQLLAAGKWLRLPEADKRCCQSHHYTLDILLTSFMATPVDC